MAENTPVEAVISDALERLRTALTAREAALAATPDEAQLAERLSALEREKSNLETELEQLRQKRDKDVAALDELIAQLKPLIEEV
jgi:ABC-type phosphate transport system auxiliary subunit